MLCLRQQHFVMKRKSVSFFIDDGVLNLLDGQNPELLLQKDFIRTFKLLDLYDIEQRFVCADSLDQYNLNTEQLIISAEKLIALR